MTVTELIAIFQNMPGDYHVQCCTPTDDGDGERYSDIISVNSSIRKGQITLICTGEIPPSAHGTEIMDIVPHDED